MRCLRVVSLAALVLAGGSLAAGCGASTGRSRSATVDERRLSALARAVNLRSTDVPKAMVVGSEGPDDGGGCFGKQASARQVHSPELESGYELDFALHPPSRQLVVSAVALAASEAAARRTVLHLTTSAGRRCILQEAEVDEAASGPLVSHSTRLTALALRPPSPGVGLTTLHTETFRSNSHHASSRRGPGSLERGRTLATDLVVFAVGRVRVSFADLHEPGHTPLAEEGRLIRLLYARAKLHAVR